MKSLYGTIRVGGVFRQPLYFSVRRVFRATTAKRRYVARAETSKGRRYALAYGSSLKAALNHLKEKLR
jgi:hypothetical protein